jgi:flagellar biosynthesis/type III secretory pathway chaperone
MHLKSPILSPALSALLSHLDREEGLLRECRSGLVRLHNSLRRSDAAAAEKARTIATAAAEGTTALAGHRNRLIQQLAVELQISSARPTLSDLIAKLPADAAAQLRTRQTTLAELTRDLRQFHRRCGDLLAYSRMFLHRLLRDVLPGSNAGPRYGPAGQTIDEPAARLLNRG